MNLNRRVPNGLPGGVRGRKFYYFLLLDYAEHGIYLDSENLLWVPYFFHNSLVLRLPFGP